MQESVDLTNRVRALEVECRKLRTSRNWILAGLACAVAIAGRAPESTPSRAGSLDARALRIVDDRGRRVAELGPDEENPGATSLRLYSRPKDQEVLVSRLMALDGGASLDLSGDGDHGAIWMDTTHRTASVSLQTTCVDSSHRATGGLKVGVARIAAAPEGGDLSLATFAPATLQGEHAEQCANYFVRTPKTKVDSVGEGR